MFCLAINLILKYMLVIYLFAVSYYVFDELTNFILSQYKFMDNDVYFVMGKINLYLTENLFWSSCAVG